MASVPTAVCGDDRSAEIRASVAAPQSGYEREVRHGGRGQRLASRHNGALVVQGLPTVIDTALPHRQPPGEPITLPPQRVSQQVGPRRDLPQMVLPGFPLLNLVRVLAALKSFLQRGPHERTAIPSP